MAGINMPKSTKKISEFKYQAIPDTKLSGYSGYQAIKLFRILSYQAIPDMISGKAKA